MDSRGTLGYSSRSHRGMCCLDNAPSARNTPSSNRHRMASAENGEWWSHFGIGRMDGSRKYSQDGAA